MKSKSPQQFLQVEEKVREKSEDTEQKRDGIHILTGSSLLLEKDKHGSNKGCYSGHWTENPPRICGSGVIRKCEKQCGALSSGPKETEIPWWA